VRCIERTLPRGLALGIAALLAACSTPLPPHGAAPAPAAARPAAAPAPSAAPVMAEAPSAGTRLAPPKAVRSLNELRAQAALRLVAANPDITYTGVPPDPLLAIPVVEVELNSDGSVRRVEVLREPRQAKETVKVAIDAIHRAAPYGDVSKLPKPWKFVETFLFNDDRKFKPRTLEL